MATNPDSIEDNPNPIRVVVNSVVTKARGWSQRILFAIATAIIATGASPLDAIGAALMVLVIYEVLK